ncbi:hypothetical protein FWK35_00015029, partial [Aphis craccivora]
MCWRHNSILEKRFVVVLLVSNRSTSRNLYSIRLMENHINNSRANTRRIECISDVLASHIFKSKFLKKKNNGTTL